MHEYENLKIIVLTNILVQVSNLIIYAGAYQESCLLFIQIVNSLPYYGRLSAHSCTILRKISITSSDVHQKYLLSSKSTTESNLVYQYSQVWCFTIFIFKTYKIVMLRISSFDYHLSQSFLFISKLGFHYFYCYLRDTTLFKSHLHTVL